MGAGLEGRGLDPEGRPDREPGALEGARRREPKHDVQWVWLRGHQRHPKNEYADWLAVRAAKEQRATDGAVRSEFDEWLAARQAKGLYAGYDPSAGFVRLEQRVAEEEDFPLVPGGVMRPGDLLDTAGCPSLSCRTDGPYARDPVTDVERFFRRLVSNLAASDPARLRHPVPLDDILRDILPYRANRRALRLDTSEDYELVLLRLCAGEGSLVRTEPEEARARFARESRARTPTSRCSTPSSRCS